MNQLASCKYRIYRQEIYPSDLWRRAAVVRVVPICCLFITRHLMATRHRFGRLNATLHRYLEVTSEHNGNKARGARCLGFVSFQGRHPRYLSCILTLADFILLIFLCLALKTHPHFKKRIARINAELKKI